MVGKFVQISLCVTPEIHPKNGQLFVAPAAARPAPLDSISTPLQPHSQTACTDITVRIVRGLLVSDIQ